jgi:hypothetical protein
MAQILNITAGKAGLNPSIEKKRIHFAAMPPFPASRTLVVQRWFEMWSITSCLIEFRYVQMIIQMITFLQFQQLKCSKFTRAWPFLMLAIAKNLLNI